MPRMGFSDFEDDNLRPNNGPDVSQPFAGTDDSDDSKEKRILKELRMLHEKVDKINRR